MRARLRKPSTWFVGVPAFLLVLVVGAPFVYTRMLNASAPKPLSLADLSVPTTVASPAAPTAGGATTTVTSVPPRAGAVGVSRPAGAVSALASSPVAASPIAGRWRVGAGTQAGYSIDDTVMGQTARVVGRTSDVSATSRSTASPAQSALPSRPAASGIASGSTAASR